MIRHMFRLFKSEDKVLVVFLILLIVLAFNYRKLIVWEKTLPAKVGELPLKSFIVGDNAEKEISNFLGSMNVNEGSSLIAEYSDGKDFIQIVSAEVSGENKNNLLKVVGSKLHFYNEIYKIRNTGLRVFESNFNNLNFYTLNKDSKIIVISSSEKLDRNSIINIYGFLRGL